MPSSPTPSGGHAPADDRIHLRFDLCTDDLDNFARDAARAQGTNRHWRLAIAYFLLTIALVAIGAFLFALQPMNQFGSGPAVATVIALGVIALWTGARGLNAAMPGNAAAAGSARVEQHDGASFGLGEQTMILVAAGVVIRLEHQDILLRWSGVADIDRTETCFYIKRLDRVCFIAPRRAFPDHDQLIRTVERCRVWHSAFAESESELVTRLCSERDFSCLSCSYNLRGHRAGPCPECGVLIDAATILRLSLAQETLGNAPPIDFWATRPAPNRTP